MLGNLTSGLQRLAAPTLRELQAHLDIARAGGRGKPRVAFLPSTGREGSALLRAYAIAEELQRTGWDCLVLHMRLSLSQRRRVLRRFRPDFVVLQQCRHPLNRVEHLRDWPIILDMDDADFLNPDLAAIMEATAAGAVGAIAGNRYIRDWALRHTPRATVVWTGTPVTPDRPPPQHGRQRIVTWAQLGPIGNRVEFAFVRQVLCTAARRTAPFTFRLYDWDAPHDHPTLADLRAAGVTLDLRPQLPYGRFLQSLRDVAVGLSAIIPVDFTLGKSFGKVLGYLDAGVPVICSDEAENGLFFRPETGIVSNDPEVWVAAICDLLDSPNRRQALADAAYADYLDRLSVAVAGRRVDGFLRDLLAERPTDGIAPA
ncbi:MAG: glycosyltransferase [Rhodobacteraceae bacterium]|jgi:hypothetical protein|nr:glycosyltransferase [Paracoccaceae bacterium]